MIRKYLNPQNDIAFKNIFGTEKNKNVILALINSVLKQQIHRPIKEVRFLQRAQDPETAAHKTSMVDLICRDEDGCIYIVEMQVAKNEHYKERAQYYAAKAYISQARRGGQYSDLQKVIFLAFTDYAVFPNKERHKSNHQILDIVTHEQDFDKFAFTIVDLLKFDEQNRKPVGELTLEEKFYYFLRHADEITPEDLEAITENDPIMQQAFHALDSFYWTPEEYDRYEAIEKRDWDNRTVEAQAAKDKGREEGRAEGREEGRAEGEAKGREEGRAEGRMEGEKALMEKLIKKGLITPEKAQALLAKKPTTTSP